MAKLTPEERQERREARRARRKERRIRFTENHKRWISHAMAIITGIAVGFGGPKVARDFGIANEVGQAILEVIPVADESAPSESRSAPSMPDGGPDFDSDSDEE